MFVYFLTPKIRYLTISSVPSVPITLTVVALCIHASFNDNSLVCAASMSDEYIAMRSASDASLKNDARLSAYKSKLAAATTVATAALQELTVTDEQKKGRINNFAHKSKIRHS